MSNPILVYQRLKNDSTPVMTEYEMTEKRPDFDD